jgi:hypothetical protein
MHPSIRDITSSKVKNKVSKPKLNTTVNPEQQEQQTTATYSTTICHVIVNGDVRMSASKHYKEPQSFVTDAAKLGVTVDINYFTDESIRQ